MHREYMIQTAARVMNGSTGIRGSELVRDVCIDSRSAKPGDLFFALKGRVTDGHRYVKDAIDRGAVASVVETGGSGGSEIIVENTLTALGDLARHYRGQFGAPLIGITGTNGKTTVKNLIASMLATRYRVVSTRGNQNSLIGLPLTLFAVNDTTEFIVAEMGTSGPGEIRRLCEIGRPRYGVITNIGPGHLEGLGTCDLVRKEKLALVQALPADGFAVINDAVGDAGVRLAVHRFSDRVLENVELKESGSSFVFEGRSFHTRLLGSGNVSNCLAAVVATGLLGIDAGRQRAALENAAPEAGRMEPLHAGGLFIINDTYNANPVSMKAAIDFARTIERPRVFVLGDMLELGEDAEFYHREIGDYAREHCRMLVTSGRYAELYKGRHFDDRRELVVYLADKLNGDELVLVKASRALMFEEIVAELARS